MYTEKNYSDSLINNNSKVNQLESHIPMICKEPELTELGRVLAHLPLEPQFARLLLFGVALKCLNPIVTLVASLSHRDPCNFLTLFIFNSTDISITIKNLVVIPMGDERNTALMAREKFGRRDYSDHLMLIRVFYAYQTQSQNQVQNFCRQNFLNQTALKMIYGIK